MGLRADGRLFIGSTLSDAPLKLAGQKSAMLKFSAVPEGKGIRMSLVALRDDQRPFGDVERSDFAAD